MLCALLALGQLGGELRMLGRERVDLLRRRVLRAEDEPGDEAVRCVGRADHRLVGVLGILGHLLQPAVDLEQRLFHVGADGELHRDHAAGVHALRRELRDALDARELLLLLDDDFLLDFLRAGAGPAGFDRDRRNLHLGRELHRHPDQRDDAEQRDQQHADGDLHRIADEGFDRDAWRHLNRRISNVRRNCELHSAVRHWKLVIPSRALRRRR